MVCWVVVIFASLISISNSNPIVHPSIPSIPLALAAKGTEDATPNPIVFPNRNSDEEFEGQFGTRKFEDVEEKSITTVSKELVPNPVTSSSVQVQDQSHVEESNSDTISKANQSEVTVEDEDDQIDGSHLIDQSKKPVASSCGNPQFRGKLWYAVLPTLDVFMTKCGHQYDRISFLYDFLSFIKPCIELVTLAYILFH